jgi:hypothetical protein
VQEREKEKAMSYILDALKKVENEKNRKTKAGGITSISGDLFQERIRRPSRGGARKTIVVIVLVSLATFAASWFFLKDDKKKGAATPPSIVTTTATAPAPLPSPPAAAPAQVLPPQQTPASPLPAPAVAVSPPTVAPKPVATVSDEPERSARTEKKSAKKPSALPPPQKAAVQTIPAPADIKLSGIAWQEERSARRVVINGFLLQEGAAVSGAKILEIHQDRVRFGSPAGIFDLRMDAATPLGPPK